MGRAEAAHLIVEVFRRAQVPWDREIKPVSKTARILGISRKTVRRAREGPLEDLSRRPKSS